MLSHTILLLLGTLSLTDVGVVLPVHGQNQAALGLSISECQTVIDCGGGSGVFILSLVFLKC